MTASKGVKRPADHLKKDEAEPVEALVSEALGRTWEIPMSALDDFETDEQMALVEDGDVYRLPGLLRRLLGDDQYQSAVELLRDPDTGRVTRIAAAEFFEALFKG